MSNPTTKVAAFDGSLDGFTGVDPIRYDSGLWLEESGINLLGNASAESNASSSTSAVGAIVTQDASEHFDGTKSFKVVTNGSAANEGVGLISATGLARANVTQKFPGAIHLKGSGTVNVWTRISYTDASSTNTANTLVTLTSEWQEIAPAIPTSDNTKTIDSVTIWARTNVTQAITFWVDAGQIDDNKPYRTSFIYGSKGAGYGFVGTAHLTASTRAASSASIPTAGIISSLSGSLAFRFTRKLDTGTLEPILEVGENNAGYDHLQMFIDSDTLWVAWDSEGALPQTIDTGHTMVVDQEYFIYTYWDGLVFGVSIDNGTPVIANRDVPTGDWGTNPLTLAAE